MLILIWFVLGVIFFLFTITAIHLLNPQLSKERPETETYPTFI